MTDEQKTTSGWERSAKAKQRIVARTQDALKECKAENKRLLSLNEEQVQEFAWRLSYAVTIQKQSECDVKFACESALAAEYIPLEMTGEQAAESELEHWND